jgi:hypothetical protein
MRQLVDLHQFADMRSLFDLQEIADMRPSAEMNPQCIVMEGGMHLIEPLLYHARV